MSRSPPPRAIPETSQRNRASRGRLRGARRVGLEAMVEAWWLMQGRFFTRRVLRARFGS